MHHVANAEDGCYCCKEVWFSVHSFCCDKLEHLVFFLM
jgi:hypothetical protein